VTTCAKCIGFAEQLTFATPQEDRKFARRLICAVEERNLILLRADCALLDLLEIRGQEAMFSHIS
jgi:hypothetical protein